MGRVAAVWGLLIVSSLYACGGASEASPNPGIGGAGGETDDGRGNICGFSNVGGASDGPHVNDPACGGVVLPDAIHHRVVEADGALTCDPSYQSPDTCTPEATQLAYQYQDEQLFLYLMFNPALAKSPITERSLRANFLWLSYRVTPPGQPGQKPVSTKRIYIGNLDDAALFSFADGRLHLKLTATADTLSRWVEPKCACYDTDVGPDFCRCDYAVGLPISEDLELVFPTL